MLRIALPVALLAASTAFAQPTPEIAARSELQNIDGESIGTVTLNSTTSGQILVIVAATDIPEGSHGIHLHETGDCSADDFSSAGGHIAGDASHGVMSEDGPHPGDLPNAVVSSDGAMNVEVFNNLIEMDEMIFDEDGAAFIIHSGPDDYASQPSGESGDRIACGVFERIE
ncbi:Cu-Zn family superoxide dismutase [Palleronia aestuarii]|uniref:Cu-Zn family superoxide dismutase n=1 Tax=Palleronia aestuarii TaxID=568105 RepID=A0A2W7N6I9_9RHOB|nr:superoxide dismutase family protein [Palleronia aestuarii]PZX15718.1 Cu-Zn family superoxide dismutase [Palleronia aestuarii]